MGATLVYFPASHTHLLSLIKERVVADRPPAVFPAANIKTGVLSNAEKLCACINPTGPGSYTDNFERLFPTVAATFNASAIRALFAAVDFVGISNYPRLPSPEVAPADFEAGLKTFSRELAMFGVDLKDLVLARGKKVWFSEVGIGGGANKGGWSRTLDPAAAAASTFFGVFTAYRADLDPWHAGVEQGAAMLRLLRKFYRALSVYVSSAGACPGCTLGWGVDGAFLWNCGSWDFQDVYPTSVARDWQGKPMPVSAVDGTGSFADAGAIAVVSGHNAAAVAGTPPAAAQAAAAMALPPGVVPALVAISPLPGGEAPAPEAAKKAAGGGPLANDVDAVAAAVVPPPAAVVPPPAAVVPPPPVAPAAAPVVPAASPPLLLLLLLPRRRLLPTRSRPSTARCCPRSGGPSGSPAYSATRSPKTTRSSARPPRAGEERRDQQAPRAPRAPREPSALRARRRRKGTTTRTRSGRRWRSSRLLQPKTTTALLRLLGLLRPLLRCSSGRRSSERGRTTTRAPPSPRSSRRIGSACCSSSSSEEKRAADF